MHSQTPNDAFAHGMPGSAPYEPAANAGYAAMEIEMPEKREVTLSRPVTLADGRSVSTITFREPTMRDMLDCGDIMRPVTHDISGGVPQSFGVEADPRAIEKWFCRLSELPSSIFTKISAADGRRIVAAIIELSGDLKLGNSNTSLPIYGSVAG
jgi:hypothetical protein